MFYLMSLMYDSLRDKNYFQFSAFLLVAIVLGFVESMLFVETHGGLFDT